MTSNALSPEEVTFFQTNGYLIKRGILDPTLLARARETMWAGAPAQLQRDEPASWVGPFVERSDDPASVRNHFTWKYRAPGSEAWMVELLPKNPTVWAIAEQLLGQGTLPEPERVRGIYCILPEGDLPAKPYSCHVDQHPFHLGVVAYIDTVPPDGGGFTVWPGSHRRFFPTFTTQYTFTPTEQTQAMQAEVNQQPYVDCYGNAGDVVFWHHRLGHSAGHNRSAQIRQAVLYDFKKRDLAERQAVPPPPDLWTDWAIAS
ncbi:MAG: phytanoyl-CoA dioxygenase family protein [Caldilineaceae bacterium]|nr:phytanoyl-CoA dioxygenase family protein [Caldilineaceae bacterium]